MTKRKYIWNKNNIKKCKIIADKSCAFTWLMNHSAEKYEKQAKIFELIILILTYLFGASGIPSLIFTDDLTIIRIVNGIVQGGIVLIGLLETIFNWMNYKKKIKKYEWISTNYSNLFLTIQKTLGKPENKRGKFSSFLKDIQEKDFALQQKLPTIPSCVFKNYYKKIGDRALNQEILFSNIYEIDVLLDSEQQKNQRLTKKEIKTKLKKLKEDKKEYPEIVVLPNITNERKRYMLERYFSPD